jgi:hypothetical protein
VSVVSGASSARTTSQTVVPDSAYLVADESGHLLVLSTSGKLIRRVPRFIAQVQALELAPDRRNAYVSIYVREQPPRLYEVDLETGKRAGLANAISPSFSPDGRRLAYVTVELRQDIKYRTRLVIRSLRTGSARIVRLPSQTPLGTPPELVINWSPDARRIAVFDGSVIRLVDVATATTVESQPSIPGGRGLAPVFLDRQTLVVLTNCCIGRQHLIAIDLRSGARTPFAEIDSPIENVRRVNSQTVLVVTALHRLVRVAPGRARVLGKRILAASV